MKLIKDKLFLQRYDEASQYEWLETNGLGGFAGSSLIGCNTRRYHGLLVAATVPPTERMVMVSKLDETIIVEDEKYELGCNHYGDAIAPKGYEFLEQFKKELFPEFIYKAGGVHVKKTILMVHGENTTLILYEVMQAEKEFTLELLPLLSVRGYHELVTRNEKINSNFLFENGVLSINAYENAPEIFISVPNSEFHAKPNWYHHFEYAREKERGLDHREDLFTHGSFSVSLRTGDVLGIILSTEKNQGRNAISLFREEKRRREACLKKVTKDDVARMLTLAADQFIVKRDESLKTVIAGYHWFTDWSRDTMIALPGLCLATGRLGDAKKILAAFAKNVSMGMLPNRFQDRGAAPEYNTVDGTLWYFIAVYKYLVATGDKKFVLREILPILTDIIEWHYKGTRYNIHADADGLLFAGEAGVQLTWMDAKVDDWVVTPRVGKPVEINALWYNALRIYAELLKLHGDKKEAAAFRKKAKTVKKQFIQLFWNDEKKYLYDVVNADEKDARLRPNQLFALGLCFPIVTDEKAESILKAVREQLYTPVGLRSLSPDDPEYKGLYEGNVMQRDGAYHQGTAWSWLMGPYIDAIMKTKNKSAREEAREVIENFIFHFNEAGIGTVSEIFDGDEPNIARGCIAQAWGVGELLRVITEYRLYRKGKANPLIQF